MGALREIAESRGYKVAFRCGTQTITFGELQRAARLAADALIAGGVRQGQVVAIGCRDPLERITAHLGTLIAGACVLPLNPHYRDELATILPASEARAVIADADFLERVAMLGADKGYRPHRLWVTGAPPTDPAGDALTLARGGHVPFESWTGVREAAPRGPERRVAADDPALLCFTSGTTGAPKGVCHTHARCLYNLEALRRAWEWDAADVLFLPVVLFHVHGLQNGIHGTVITGCTTVLPDTPLDGSSLLDTLEAERCTMMFGVPTHYQRLLTAAAAAPDRARDVARAMRVFVSGSAPLHPDTFRQFHSRFSHELLERYGMTETLMIASNPLNGERRPGTVGHPLPGVATRVVDPDTGADRLPGDEGEIWVRGPSVFDAYHARPGFTHPADADAFRDGWFRTGDLGAWEPDGRLRLLGRRTDLIISGGMNVAPNEVEQALLAHPDVTEAGVAGVADDDLGEAVAAAIVLRAGAAADLDQFVGHVAHRLASYKNPRRWLVVDALPRNAVGKLDRTALRAQLADAPRHDPEVRRRHTPPASP